MTCNIEIESLIDEIEKRPALYKKAMREYADAILKKKLWEEVCEAVVPSWSELSSEERRIEGHNLQKKWINMRTCFKRELNAQQNVKSGQAAMNRRKYIYFEKLLFLLPCLQTRPTESNIDLTETDADGDTEDSGNVPSTAVRRTLTPRKRRINNTVSNSEVDEALLNALKNSEVDEDYNFAMSIVPSLRELSADEKLEAKIQILSIFKQIRNMRYPNLQQLTTPLNVTLPPVQIQQSFDPVINRSNNTSQDYTFNQMRSPQPGHSSDTAQSYVSNFTPSPESELFDL